MRDHLSTQEDVFKWNLISGKSRLSQINVSRVDQWSHTLFLRIYIWKIKVPLKIKKFT
jgi:hypothetical protein